MSTTAQKLEYLGTTKSQLKDMINYGLDNNNKITSSTTFRNYVTSVKDAFLEALRNPDTLFTNLPKKSGSGSVISLNDTANAPMRIELGASELSQSGTPTPSSPQDIHTISGSNKVVVCGKNFLSGIEQGTLDSSGQPTSSSTAIRSKNYDLVEPSTQYTFSMNGTSGGVNVAEYTSNKTFISYTFSGGTFTTSATTRYIKISKTGTTSDLFQLELGNTATTYEPYTSQEADIDLDTLEYCKIGNYENKFIRTSGKNLFDKDNIVAVSPHTITTTLTGFTYTRGGTSSSDSFVASYTTMLKPNTTYSMYIGRNSNLSLFFYSDTLFGTSLTRNLISSSSTYISYTFTTDNTGKVVVGFYSTNEIPNTTGTINNIIIEEGTKTLAELQDYEPYGSNEWYIKKNIGKVVLDGTEEWEERVDVSITGYKCYRNSSFDYTLIGNTNYGKSNYFGFATSNVADTFRLIQTQYYAIQCIIDENLASNNTAFKTWLSTHNTDVYYVLATPTYTDITGTLAEQLEYVYQKMLSQEGVTNISQINNDLSFNMSILAIEE